MAKQIDPPHSKSVEGSVPPFNAPDDIVRKARQKMIDRTVKGNKPKLPTMY